MKKNAFLLSCFLLISCMAVSPVKAGEETELTQAVENQHTEATPETLYDQVLSAEELTLNEALDILTEIDTENADILSLREKLQTLLQCEGMFIQEKDENSSGKTYTATISFSLKNGTVMCAVDYDNYMGELSEAPVDSLNDDPDYSFVTKPEGILFGNSHPFEILLGKENVHIAWGSSEYHLVRFYGSAEVLEDDRPDFEHSETYQYITNSLDNMFEDWPHRFKYVDEEKTLYAFIAFDAGTKEKIQQFPSVQESWNNLLTSFSTLTESCQSSITLAVRDGISDLTTGHCTIMFVDELKDSDIYSPDSILGITSDGEITYDFLNESGNTNNISADNATSKVDSSISNNSDSSTRTRGEENALKKAHSYLDYSAFSYSGLVDQLEYEGFSSSEATYAADHCGANWKEQAVKKAESYLSYSSFSYDGLVDQLKYEGFTHEQAVYGANMTY